MRGEVAVALLLVSLCIGLAAGDWSILTTNTNNNVDNEKTVTVSNAIANLTFSLANYCEAWRLNVELDNIRGYKVVPDECTDYIGKYMTSKQYEVDLYRAAEEMLFFLTDSFYLSGDGKDAWIFDLDDVLLSTVPFYKKHEFGGSEVEKGEFEEWVRKAKAPAVAQMKRLFHYIRAKGLKVVIISSRAEHLREATVDNLFSAGYHGWTRLILRCPDDNSATFEEYKAQQRGKLVQEGYRLWGIVGSQWSSLGGYSTAKRIFKLPNPMYYEY